MTVQDVFYDGIAANHCIGRHFVIIDDPYDTAYGPVQSITLYTLIRFGDELLALGSDGEARRLNEIADLGREASGYIKFV